MAGPIPLSSPAIAVTRKSVPSVSSALATAMLPGRRPRAASTTAS